jgi:hypothetical protein
MSSFFITGYILTAAAIVAIATLMRASAGLTCGEIEAVQRERPKSF